MIESFLRTNMIAEATASTNANGENAIAPPTVGITLILAKFQHATPISTSATGLRNVTIA